MKKAVWWSLRALLLFFVVEALLFRAGWYTRYLQPQSTAGFFEYHYYWLREAAPTRQPEVAVVGDSRVGEGFHVVAANAAASQLLNFWNLGISGATPRAWYYLLRDGDPDRRRFAVIVLALDHYSDVDSYDDLRDRIGDLNYLTGRLRLTDCPDFAASMNLPENRRAALLGCVLKGVPLRRDAHEFLRNIRARVQASRYERQHGLHDNNVYPGKPVNLRGLTADFGTGAVSQAVIHFPDGLGEDVKASIRAMVAPDWAPDRGVTTGYRRLWLGRILDLYRDSPTRIVFVQMPRRPLVAPADPVAPRFIQSVTGRARVSVIAGERFTDLERPEFFADGQHLNADGGNIFTDRLVGDVASVLGIR